MTAASLVSEPVCDWAPRAPALLAPAASTTTGVPASTAAAAASTNPRPSRKSSTYTAIASVAGSAAQAVTSSTSLTSAWLPSETNREIPSPRAAKQPVQLDRQVAALAEQRDAARAERVGREVGRGVCCRPRRGSSGRPAPPRRRGPCGSAPACRARPACARLAESGGDRDDRPRPLGEHAVDGLLETGLGYGDHGEVDRPLELVDGRHARLTRAPRRRGG